VRALLVDDERLARAGLRHLLEEHQDVMVVGEAQNGEEAAQKIRRLQPDVVFLDVEMPGQGGLAMLDELEEVPPVVFTTAYQEYAVRAFAVSALDYLVKPIVPERLAAALDKVRKMTRESQSMPTRMRHVFLRDGKHCWIVPTYQIRLLESVGNYTRVHFASHSPLIYKSLNNLESRLDPTVFFRASRSHIINLEEIKSVEPEAEGGLVVVLTSGARVMISRRQSRTLRNRLSL
jgi:two-component system, LytTR family, response regulator